jgi:hypothetical protein
MILATSLNNRQLYVNPNTLNNIVILWGFLFLSASDSFKELRAMIDSLNSSMGKKGGSEGDQNEVIYVWYVVILIKHL